MERKQRSIRVQHTTMDTILKAYAKMYSDGKDKDYAEYYDNVIDRLRNLILEYGYLFYYQHNYYSFGDIEKMWLESNHETSFDPYTIGDFLDFVDDKEIDIYIVL